jgi:hypothetical protein
MSNINRCIGNIRTMIRQIPNSYHHPHTRLENWRQFEQTILSEVVFPQQQVKPEAHFQIKFAPEVVAKGYSFN